MDFKKTQNGRSIDGFNKPVRSRQPIFRESSNPLSAPAESRPKPPVANHRKTARPYAIPQVERPKSEDMKKTSKSLVGMTLPNNNYSKALGNKTKKSKSKKSWSRKRKVVTTLLTIVVVLLGFFGWFGSRILGSLDKVFHGNIFSDAQALFSQANLRNTDGRVNILVAGDSSDDPGHPGANLTDSIMVASIDTKTHTGFLFSIPRDLWVYVPGLNSYQKINAAADDTNFSASGYPNGGMGQLQQIVQTDLGIPIDYYALVNYVGFKDGVNAVGGITVDINSPDPRGIYDAFSGIKLPNGEDTINGQQALELARARGDGSAGDKYYGFPESDFTRTMYQREMGVAILKKATSIGVLTNPLKITSLFSSLSNNVQTNLNLQDALTLDQLTKGMNFSKLGSYAYSSSLTGSTNPLLVSYTDPSSGAEALIPSDGIGDYAALKGYYQTLVSSNPVTKENASVEVLNGTDTTGLAKSAEQKLQSKGLINVSIGDTNGNYTSSMIVDNSGGKDPATKALLEKMFPGSVVTSDTGSTEAREASSYNQTFVVILGQSYANSNAPTSSVNTGSYTSDSSTGSYSSSSN